MVRKGGYEQLISYHKWFNAVLKTHSDQEKPDVEEADIAFYLIDGLDSG
jgi:hypothetical protein